jgi:hypothetical protein
MLNADSGSYLTSILSSTMIHLASISVLRMDRTPYLLVSIAFALHASLRHARH